ncbi:hypothetical protein ACLVWU_03150 [Bdellovibrio sp. HCB290]|uniref:hypothetical protein n=1 Tax=Bdellovibrio sp. HCB290 TaxID=3394356 RepID=UPI0039B52847
MTKWALFSGILFFSVMGIASEDFSNDQPTHTCAISTVHFMPSTLFAGPLEWWSVAPSQVATAPCKIQRPPSDSEMLAELQPSSLKKKSETLYGIKFKDEDPELLQLFRDLHSMDISLSGAAPLTLKSHCDKVVCSTQSIYGPRVGIQLLYMLKHFGFNGSHLRAANASPWTSDELDDVLAALSDYPIELYPLDYNRKLIHGKRGSRVKLPEGESVANSTMEIFDYWNNLTLPERQQTLLHELGHVVARKKNLDESPEWLKVGGWAVRDANKSNRTYSLVDPSKAVSLYGKTNPHEDFAESVVAFRFGGSRLKTEQPLKYDLLKERVFDGKEYLSSSACLASKSRTETKKVANNVLYNGALAKAKKNADKLDSRFIEDAQQACLDTLLKVMIGETGSVENCTSRALQRLQLKKASKGKKLVGELLTDAQLNAISFKDGTEADFSMRVRTKFSSEAAKSFTSDFRESLNRGTCSAWAKSAQMLFTSSPLLSELKSQDPQYFFRSRRYEKMENFFDRACQTARQNAGRLETGILQNLP